MAKYKISVIGLFLIAAILSCSQANNDPQAEVTIEQVNQKIADSSDVVLLDVRTEQEFTGQLGHLPGAMLIPIEELADRLEELAPYREKEIVVYCRSGNRSGHGAKLLNDQGFNAFNMLGGMIAWNEKYGRPDDQKNNE
jgi:rhodanese-related sulfurtransferase